MKALAILWLLLPALAHGQFKCTDAEGRISFQQAPCPTSEAQQALKLRADVAPGSASGTSASAPQGASVELRMLKALERERRVRDLEREIADTENALSGRGVMMSNELAALQLRKRSANNNLAGATWEQSISAEMQAVAAKYKALNDVDAARLKVLRSNLGTAKLAVGQ